jgi:farnesyl diphosphate synthase
LSNFSFDKCYFIAQNKTAVSSFYIPVVLVMYMAGVASADNIRQAKEVLTPLGVYFQVQDDYIDCCGDPEYSGNLGTDI